MGNQLLKKKIKPQNRIQKKMAIFCCGKTFCGFMNVISLVGIFFFAYWSFLSYHNPKVLKIDMPASNPNKFIPKSQKVLVTTWIIYIVIYFISCCRLARINKEKLLTEEANKRKREPVKSPEASPVKKLNRSIDRLDSEQEE